MKLYNTPRAEFYTISLANVIATSFAIDSNGKPIKNGSQLVGRSRFDDMDDDDF